MKQIKLSGGDCVLVDDSDFELLSKSKWRVSKHSNTSYAKNKNGERMHRLILGAKDGEEVDHINGNGLDNRRANLRIATHNQNMHNRRRNKKSQTGYKGVYPNGRNYQARIIFLGTKVNLGTYKTPQQAAMMYDVAARMAFGVFARTNFDS